MMIDEAKQGREAIAINGCKTKVERFFDLYAARFGALTEKDGLDEWRRIAEPQGYDEQAMVEALDSIADKLGENVHSKKPRIAWVKGEYNKARDKWARVNGGKPDERFVCASCAGTGYFVGIRTRDGRCDAREMLRNPGSIKSQLGFKADGTRPASHVIRNPCHCHKGSAEYEKVFPFKDGHQRQDIEAAKRCAELSLPNTEAYQYAIERIERHGECP